MRKMEGMKIYPKHESREEDRGFTAEEIRKNHHMLYADVTCERCGKVQSVAMAGSSDRGKCIKCGGATR
jgi:ribosomal protein S27AE